MPERLRDRILLRRVGKQVLQDVQPTERRRMPQLLDTRATLGQQLSDMPRSVADRVVQRRPDRPARQLHVRAAIEQRAGDIDIVAAGRPMQRALTVLIVVASDVRVRAALDQQAHHLRSAWGISRPVRHDVQQSAAAIARHPTGNKVIPDLEHTDHGRQITGAQRRNGGIGVLIPRLGHHLPHRDHPAVRDRDHRRRPVAGPPGPDTRNVASSRRVTRTWRS